MFHNIESKVYAATVGTGAGAIVAAFILWLLGTLVWGVSFAAGHATDAVAAVPAPVSGVVGLVVTVGGSFLGGYAADHTSRPDLVAAPADDTIAQADGANA